MPTRNLHPDIPVLMQALRDAGVPALGSVMPEVARASYTKSRRRLQPLPAPVFAVKDLLIPRTGRPLPARLYHGTQPEQNQPCLVFLHGGGWVLGSIESHDGLCRHLARQANCAVLSVDYRLAPEYPYPAALEDGVLALNWLAANAAGLGIDAARLAVGGDSAGGNLAAVLALLGRDGAVPACVFQLLFYPATDLTRAHENDAGMASDIPLTAEAMRYFIGHYTPDPATRAGWQASPLLSKNLAGAPPAFVLTCGHDPLHSEGRLYAARLEQANVAVTSLHLSDQVHGILNLGGTITAAGMVLDLAAAAMRNAFDILDRKTQPVDRVD
jgi:acetyl esterase